MPGSHARAFALQLPHVVWVLLVTNEPSDDGSMSSECLSQLPSAQWLDLPHCVLPAGEGAEELVLGQCPRSARLIAPKDMQSTLWIHKPGGGRGTEPPALLLGCSQLRRLQWNERKT